MIKTYPKSEKSPPPFLRRSCSLSKAKGQWSSRGSNHEQKNWKMENEKWKRKGGGKAVPVRVREEEGNRKEKAKTGRPEPAAYGKSRLDPPAGRTPQKRKIRFVRSLQPHPSPQIWLVATKSRPVKATGPFPVGPHHLFYQMQQPGKGNIIRIVGESGHVEINQASDWKTARFVITTKEKEALGFPRGEWSPLRHCPPTRRRGSKNHSTYPTHEVQLSAEKSDVI
ncbi:hypothetical protein EDB83DRAFT_2314819 [Lactarius deliciosus]|nr:hypothetical protein EDB83DRAFT_2314819 [Lactarius deliciosus]